MIPIRDDNPSLRRPTLTIGLIVLFALVFVYTDNLGSLDKAAVTLGLGAIPAIITGEAQLALSLRAVPSWFTPFTSLFLHADLIHLGGNMLFLWIFGARVEGVMGPARYLLFFFLCGIVAVLTQTYFYPELQVPIIGASGAIAGIQAAYLLVYPYARVLTWLPPFWPPLRVPAVIFISGWFGIQLLNSLQSDPAFGGTGYLVHVGGFLGGLLLLPLLKYRHVCLWQRPLPIAPSEIFMLSAPLEGAEGLGPDAPRSSGIAAEDSTTHGIHTESVADHGAATNGSPPPPASPHGHPAMDTPEHRPPPAHAP